MMNRPNLGAITGGLLAGLALAWLATHVCLGFPWNMVGSSNDGLNYLWTADALSRGLSHPASSFGAEKFWHGRFPPGYPLYLSLFGASSSGDGMRLANLAQMASVLALAVLVARLTVLATGSRLAAAVAVGYVLGHPMMTPWSLELFSEPLFTSMLIVACLVAEHRSLRHAALWAAFLIGGASLVRSMGLVALPAIAAWVYTRERSLTRAAGALAIAALPMLAWTVLRASVAPGDGDHYLAQFREAAALHAAEPWAFLTLQSASFVKALAPGGLPDVLRYGIGGGLLIFFLHAVWRERSRPQLATLLALPMLLLLLGWPFPAHLDRLLGPLVPLMVIVVLRHAINACRAHGTSPAALRFWLLPAMAGVALAGLLAALITLWSRAVAIDDPELRPYLRNASVLGSTEPASAAAIHHASLLLIEEIDRVVPPGACVSTRFPAFAALRTTTPLAVTVMPFAWPANPCRYVLAINLASPQDSFDAFFPITQIDGQFRTVLLSKDADSELVYAALITTPD